MEHHETEHQSRTEVEQAVDNARKLWDRFGNTVLTAVLIVALVVAGLRLYNWRQTQVVEEAWGSLNTTFTPQALLVVADENDGVPAVQALARLRAGDLFLQEALTAAGQAEAAASTTEPDADAPEPADPASLLQQAGQAYQMVLDTDADPLYGHNARLGLAAVAESQAQWDQATDHYQQVIQNAAPAYPVLVQQAQARLDLLPQVQQPLPFGPEPTPIALPVPLTQPATQPAPTTQPAPPPATAPTTQPQTAPAPEADG
jgi:hypothetical protein